MIYLSVSMQGIRSILLLTLLAVAAIIPQNTAGTAVTCEAFKTYHACRAHSECRYWFELRQCRPAGSAPPCHDWPLPELCVSHGCVFDHEAWACRHQGEATPCRLYKRADECATAGHCVFDTKYRACHEATGAAPCEAARSAADCAELRQAGAQTCVWSAHLAQCSAAPDGEALCSRMEIEPACVDTKGCAWHGAAGICRRADDTSAVPCWQFRFADGCNAAPGCWFDEQVLFCRAKGEQRSCLQLHDPVHCMAEPHCEWSRKANMCVRAGQPIECFMIAREQECQSLGCEYYGLLCHAKGSRVPCDQCTDAPMCYANGCLWNPAAKRPCAPLTALQTEMRALTNHPGAPALDCTHFPCTNVPTQCPAGQVLQRPVRRCCAECAPDMAACLSIDTEAACTKARPPTPS